MASPVRFAKVRKQLEAAGYRLVRIRTSHHIFERQGKPIISIPVHNKQVKPFYARQVQKIIAADEAASGGGKEGQVDGKEGQGGEGPKPRGK